MFTVDDIDDVVARLRSHGGELVGEIAQYEDKYRLCFLRGPEGMTIDRIRRVRSTESHYETRRQPPGGPPDTARISEARRY